MKALLSNTLIGHIYFLRTGGQASVVQLAELIQTRSKEICDNHILCQSALEKSVLIRTV